MPKQHDGIFQPLFLSKRSISFPTLPVLKGKNLKYYYHVKGDSSELHCEWQRTIFVSLSLGQTAHDSLYSLPTIVNYHTRDETGKTIIGDYHEEFEQAQYE